MEIEKARDEIENLQKKFATYGGSSGGMAMAYAILALSKVIKDSSNRHFKLLEDIAEGIIDEKEKK